MKRSIIAVLLISIISISCKENIQPEIETQKSNVIENTKDVSADSRGAIGRNMFAQIVQDIDIDNDKTTYLIHAGLGITCNFEWVLNRTKKAKIIAPTTSNISLLNFEYCEEKKIFILSFKKVENDEEAVTSINVDFSQPLSTKKGEKYYVYGFDATTVQLPLDEDPCSTEHIHIFEDGEEITHAHDVPHNKNEVQVFKNEEYYSHRMTHSGSILVGLKP